MIEIKKEQNKNLAAVGKRMVANRISDLTSSARALERVAKSPTSMDIEGMDLIGMWAFLGLPLEGDYARWFNTPGAKISIRTETLTSKERMVPMERAKRLFGAVEFAVNHPVTTNQPVAPDFRNGTRNDWLSEMVADVT